MILSPLMKMRGVVIIGIILIELCAGLSLKLDSAHLSTTDFVNFYAAATIIHEGNTRTLYTRQTQDRVLNVIQNGKAWQYFLHPPFEALALSPFAYTNLEHAYRIWLLINIGILALYPLVVGRRISIVNRKPYLGWVGLAFVPALIAISLGQDSILLLLIVTLSYLQFADKNDFRAGFVLAFMAIKFQYLLIFAFLIIASRKFRFLSGIVAGGIFLGIISLLITGVGGLVQYAKFIYDFDVHLGYGSLNPTLMVNWRGFLTGITGNMHLSGWSFAGEAFLLITATIYLQSIRKMQNSALIFALYVGLSLVASPYAHFPDMTLMLLPALLALDWIIRQPIHKFPEKSLFFCTLILLFLPFVLLIANGGYWWKMKIYFLFISIMLFLVATAWNLMTTSSLPPASASPPFAGQLPRDHS